MKPFLNLTRQGMMQAASMIQNPRVMPRKITPEDVMRRTTMLDSMGDGIPRSAQEVEGMSDGVQRAKRAEAESDA